VSDYLKKRFPLSETSTIRMSGKAVYNLVRYDTPGIIAAVELFAADANEVRKAYRKAIEDAFNAGYNEGWTDRDSFGD